MVTGEGFRTRLFLASLAKARELKRNVTHPEIAQGVAEVLGEPAKQPSTVGRWFKGTLPDLRTTAALASYLGCDPGWLAFGEESSALGPDDHVAAAAEPVPQRQRKSAHS